VTLAAVGDDTGFALLELGLLLVGLAVLARLSHRVGITPVPLYLLAGLAFGDGGIAPLDLNEDFVETGAAIGVVLLLLSLGLEYRPDELLSTLRTSMPSGVVDLVLNATPGFLAGLLLGWGITPSLLLAGVTYISSSGIVAKVLSDLGRLGNRETPAVLALLVLEDLAMAVYLPIVAVLVAGRPGGEAVAAVTIAVLVVLVVLAVAVRWGDQISLVLASRSDEALLLGLLGATLLVAGGAEQLQVSSAVGAFLVGLGISEAVTQRVGPMLAPLRDLFAATFFVFFGLQLDPSDLPGSLVAASLLGVTTAATKAVAGAWAARRTGAGPRGQRRAGVTLIARGEFSIVIANLGVTAGIEPALGPLAAAYVLVLAVIGPLLAKIVR
jgi:CPA2 family monovalent cation:H+ antiporter-2